MLEIYRQTDIKALKKIRELATENKQLREALRELLKGGAHDGPCDNDDFPDDCCEKHWDTAKRRRKEAKELLSRLDP